MIGLFNDCFPPILDGVSLTVYNYARWLNARHGEVCVVTPDAPGKKDTELFPVYRYRSMPIPMRKPYRYGLPELDLNFRKKMERIPFQLVHAHCPFTSGEVALKIARQRGIPLVATFHSKYRDDFLRICPYPVIVNQILKKIIDFYHKADEVWVPQASVEETLREYGYRGHVEVVDNGNDFAGTGCNELLKRKTREELGLRPDVPVLLFVGQHIREKNVFLILNALARLRHRTFKMFFIGDGYARPQIIEEARKLHLLAREDSDESASVEFLGTVHDRSVLRKYYLAAHLFLFPSLYDNAPLVVREAAAMQVPSLMIRNSTASAIISDGFNGFLSSNDLDAYTQVLDFLLDRPVLLHNAGVCASRTLSRSWADIAEEVHDRYQHLIYRFHHQVV